MGYWTKDRFWKRVGNKERGRRQSEGKCDIEGVGVGSSLCEPVCLCISTSAESTYNIVHYVHAFNVQLVFQKP